MKTSTIPYPVEGSSIVGAESGFEQHAEIGRLPLKSPIFLGELLRFFRCVKQMQSESRLFSQMKLVASLAARRKAVAHLFNSIRQFA